MNAGAYGGELKDVLKEAVVMTEQGEILTLPVQKSWTWDIRTSMDQKSRISGSGGSDLFWNREIMDRDQRHNERI